MAELVDALVSNTNEAIRAGSIPALGTKRLIIFRLSAFYLLYVLASVYLSICKQFIPFGKNRNGCISYVPFVPAYRKCVLYTSDNQYVINIKFFS